MNDQMRKRKGWEVKNAKKYYQLERTDLVGVRETWDSGRQARISVHARESDSTHDVMPGLNELLWRLRKHWRKTSEIIHSGDSAGVYVERTDETPSRIPITGL